MADWQIGRLADWPLKDQARERGGGREESQRVEINPKRQQ